jgi:signal transduction histidine kinase
VKGSGLGLAIAKKIMELHKGKVWVEDNSPRGAVFVAELPVSRSDRVTKLPVSPKG